MQWQTLEKSNISVLKKKLDIYWKKFDCSAAADILKKFGAILIEEWQILFLKTFG